MGATAYIRTQTLWVGGDFAQQKSKFFGTNGQELVMVTSVENNFQGYESFSSS